MTGEPKNPGRFGRFGGRFVAETLMGPVAELAAAYDEAKSNSQFQEEIGHLLQTYVGRPTPLTYAANLSRQLGGAKIYLKREDLTHTGAHKINNTIGQGLLARRMGKKRLIAETGAGQHGVATATVAALLGMPCQVFMGERDTIRQALNVYRMELLGAEVVPVKSGSRTLKDAINEAMREWVTHPDCFYLLGSVLGPDPYPRMVRDFQSVIGRETREQILAVEGKLPDYLVACVGGGSNAIGLFFDFIEDETVALHGVEAGGHGISSGEHAARFQGGKLGVFHGTCTYFLQDDSGQIRETHSISAGLDYAGVGPEHAHLQAQGRAKYTSVTDEEALHGLRTLCRTEGILPALESAHAVAYAMQLAPTLSQDQVIVVNLSGRGDKDVESLRKREEK